MKISAKQYAETLYELCKGKDTSEIDPLMQEFVQFLAHRGKTKIIKELQHELKAIVDREQGIVTVRVTLAEKDAKAEKAVVSELQEIFGKNMEMHFHYDPKIIGGIIVTVGDTVVDASVSYQLEKLRLLLHS